MALEMRQECEKCRQVFAGSGIAMICSYECTFCEKCAAKMKTVCPNCGGELVQRPRRK